MNSFLFVHIPKTAGTSFRKGCENSIGKNNIFYDYGPDAIETKETSFQYLYDQNRPDLQALRKAMDSKENSLLAGHFPVHKFLEYFSYGQIIVFLRNPIERLYSDFLHFKRQLGFTGTLEEFCENPSFRNRQSWFLQGIDIEKIRLIGITERYNESIEKINELTGFNVEKLVLNAADEKPEISENNRKLLEEASDKDLALYNKALALFESSIYREQHDYNKFSASMKHMHNILQGWIVAHPSLEVTQKYILKIDGKPYKTFTPTIYRPDLVDLGISRSGSCGFKIQIPKVDKNTLLEVTPLNNPNKVILSLKV